MAGYRETTNAIVAASIVLTVLVFGVGVMYGPKPEPKPEPGYGTVEYMNQFMQEEAQDVAYDLLSRAYYEKYKEVYPFLPRPSSVSPTFMTPVIFKEILGVETLTWKVQGVLTTGFVVGRPRVATFVCVGNMRKGYGDSWVFIPEQQGCRVDPI